MADVFISYKAERRGAARHLSKVLAGNGYTAWYDYGLIPGENFESRLMTEIAAAKVVLVLWCGMAVGSEWVQKEARFARQKDKYLPCWIETAKLPQEFAGAETIDLTNWDGAPRSHVLDRLLSDVGRRIGRRPSSDFDLLRNLDEDWRGFGAPSLSEFALGDIPAPMRAASTDIVDLLRPPPPGISERLSTLWKAAQRGDLTAIVEVAAAKRFGEEGLEQKYPEADREVERIYRFAAERGNPRGQVLLGNMYEMGEGGLLKDEREALRLIRLAVAQGDAGAMAYLADIHGEGKCGLPKDRGESIRLLTLAAQKGHANSQSTLGQWRLNGLNGMRIDVAEGVRWLKLAARQGETVSQHFLKERGETW